MKRTFAALMISTALVAAPASAGGLFGKGGLIRGDVGNFLDKNVEKPVTTPIARAVEDTVVGTVEIAEDLVKGSLAISGAKLIEDLVIEGKSLDQSLDESLRDGKDMVRGISKAPTLANPAFDGITEISGNILGPDVERAVGVLYLPQKIVSHLPSAITETVIGVTENGDNIEDVVGIPLNAAIREAHDHYDGKAKPLPSKVFTLLKGEFGEEHLANVRYVVDDSTGSIAALINLLQSQIGDATESNHAVVIDDIIVFANEPDHGLADIYFWAHEVQHTVQYSQMGIDGFAAKYTTDYKGLEDDADRAADRVIENIRTLLAAFS